MATYQSELCEVTSLNITSSYEYCSTGVAVARQCVSGYEYPSQLEPANPLPQRFIGKSWMISLGYASLENIYSYIAPRIVERAIGFTTHCHPLMDRIPIGACIVGESPN